MHTAQASLFTREDTFFGICQGLGEDLRIHPNLLRLGLALALFFNPVLTVASYFAAGLLVLVSRFLFPAPVLSTNRSETAESREAEAEAEALPLAA